MTFPHFDPDDHQANQDPRIIQAADQIYAQANELLAQALAGINEIEPSIYAHANDDASVLFDYLKDFIKHTHALGGNRAVAMTTVICAAALTRLARASRVETDPLAHLDKEIEDDDR